MKEMNSSPEQVWEKIRGHKRITIEKATEINSCKSRIKNISPCGIMVSSTRNHNGGPIEIMMEIDGSTVMMEGEVVWSTSRAHDNCFDMGICITKAPSSYKQFVDNLYLEVKEKNVNYNHLFNQSEDN